MKFLAITILAVCLIQGNSAQFSGLRHLVSGAASSVQNTASSAWGGVKGSVSGAINTAVSTAQNIRSKLSGGGQALIDSATNDLSVDQLTEAANNLSPQELVDVVSGAQAEVEARVTGITATLEDTVSSVTAKAEEAVEDTTSTWNAPVNAAIAKAKEAGVDVKECAVDSIVHLGNNITLNAVKCANKVQEAFTLTKNIVNLPIEAVKISTKALTGYRKCSSYKMKFAKRACQMTVLVPAGVKGALLVTNAVKYTTQATTLATTMQSQCASGVALKHAREAVALSSKIVNCVNGKLSA